MPSLAAAEAAALRARSLPADLLVSSVIQVLAALLAQAVTGRRRRAIDKLRRALGDRRHPVDVWPVPLPRLHGLLRPPRLLRRPGAGLNCQRRRRGCRADLNDHTPLVVCVAQYR